MLKLRKVELLGFKSFCEKTPITFSGSGITCIVGPNGCGKSNVVDAISWVLGEQSHKMLRAERMSDCIFNGTAKRPPLGVAEVTLTLVDAQLSEAVAKVIDGVQASEANAEVPGETAEPRETAAEVEVTADGGSAVEASAPEERKAKRRGHKPAITLRPGEVVVGRRLYRSGQSEYLVNGRAARLRDVQELFMGIGLGPDTYAIIEQGRIGQILNSKPMDRRAIIEEAAGITMYKTKRRLSEAKLEASKLNLSRLNDILVEVEKQLASLKRQASKARRYAELREQMRALLRSVLASKAEHLDIEAARLENLLREMRAVEERESGALHSLEAEQERLSTRNYELDAELRQVQNLLNQAAIELDRAENRITFNQEQAAQLESRATRITMEIEDARRQAVALSARLSTQREAIDALRVQTAALETALRASMEQVSGSATEQEQLEARTEELRLLAARYVEESSRGQAESQRAEEAATRLSNSEEQRSNAVRALEEKFTAVESQVQQTSETYDAAERKSREIATTVREAQASLGTARRTQQQTSQQLEGGRQELSAARARQASIDQILRERAYTADAVQKLFNTGGGAPGSSEFYAVGLLADYAEVQEQYEAAIEQFLRDELEYVVVESFDHARAGVNLLRNEVGGRATFFVDSLRSLNLDLKEADSNLPLAEGVIARLDRLIEFRDPLGPATKHFLTKLRTAYLVEDGTAAERIARENPHSYYLTPDGTCYHGRMVSGGRPGDAGPLALKRELRLHETEAARLERQVEERQDELARIAQEVAETESRIASATSEQIEAEKSLVAAAHQRDQAYNDLARIEQQLDGERAEIGRLHAEAAAARIRAEQAHNQHAEAARFRAAAEAEAAESTRKLAALRASFQSLQEGVVARREELAVMSERLASAESSAQRLAQEFSVAEERATALQQQHDTLLNEKANLESACEQLVAQVTSLRTDKSRYEGSKSALETEWQQARARTGEIEEAVRFKRQSLEELRTQRGDRQIEKVRNDADRDYLRQTCVTELNAQPEELMAQETQLLIGEDLIAAETNYNEMKARVEAMGPVNMMALEEFQECEQRNDFLRRERDDLVQSIENTQLTINEIDQVSRQKFEEAFNFINAHFAIAFQSLFGGGHGEMRLGEPDSSGEAGIDIVAQPPGKRLQSIMLLSGGEKALTALSLLIAVFRYSPSPFCILDEVDAPLDEANVGRFNKMLADMCGQTQFIVVTHNRRTMEMGSVLYGVTMQEPGVSKLVSVKWEEAAATEPRTAAASNAA